MLIGILIILAILLLILKLIPFNKADSNHNQVISGENITNVFVSTNQGDIEITSSEGDEIRINLIGKTEKKLSRRYKLKVKEKGNEVSIEAKKKARLSQNFTILIELPRKKYEQIQVQAEVANIDVSKITAKNIYLKSSVGNIAVIETDGIINANAEVGNVHLQFEELINNISAKTDVGNVVVKTEKSPSALQTTCKTSIGTTIVNLPNLTNGSIGVGGPQVNLTTEVGDVSLLLVGE